MKSESGEREKGKKLLLTPNPMHVRGTRHPKGCGGRPHTDTYYAHANNFFNYI